MTDNSNFCQSLKNINSVISKKWVTIISIIQGDLNVVGMTSSFTMAITQMAMPPQDTSIISSDDTCAEQNNYLNTTKLELDKLSNIKRYNWSEETQGIVFSFFFVGYIVTSLLGGIICRKLGANNTFSLSILSSALLTLLIPHCVEWGGAKGLIVSELLIGLGQGASYPAIAHLLAHWIPEDERSKVGSMIFSGSALGNIFGMVFSGIILQYSVWPMVFYLYGTFGLISFIFNWAFCYEKPSDNPYISQQELTYLQSKIKNTHKVIAPTPWRHILTSPALWSLMIMKFGNAWVFMTILADMPKYMIGVLKFSALHNGFLSSIPQVTTWLGATTSGWISDKLINDKIMSITVVRKIGCTMSTLGPAIFLVAASYAGCNGFLVVALQSVGLAMFGCSYASLTINILDLSPNYASSIMGIKVGIGLISGVLAPYVAGVLTPNQTISEWRFVFWIIFAVAMLTSSIFMIFGSGKIQEWNDPAFLNETRNVPNADGTREGIELLPLSKA